VLITRRQWLTAGSLGVGAAVWGLSRTRGVRRADFDETSELAALAARVGRDVATVLRDATLAPSGHNTQPWRVRLEGPTTLRVEVAPERVPRAVDPTRREVVLSLGAFVENAVVSARAKGMGLEIEPLLTSLQDDVVARLRLVGQARTPERRDARLAARRTLRSPFSTRSIPQSTLDAFLRGADPGAEAVLFLPSDSSGARTVTEMTIEANRAQAAQNAVQEELADWLRWSDGDVKRHRDGLTTEAIGLDGLAGWYVRNFFQRSSSLSAGNRRRAAETARDQATACGGWLVLCADDHARAILSLGRTFERLALDARPRSLGLHPMSQALEESPWQDQISAALGLSKPARMLVRVGIVENYPAAVSVRRSVLDVMAS